MNSTQLDVTYREMVAEEADFLLPALQKHGWSIPHPKLATVIVALIGERIVGYAVIQLIPHAEPIDVIPEFRGTGIAEGLAEKASEFMDKTGAKGWLSVAQNVHAEKLCEHVGMKRVEGTIYRKG